LILLALLTTAASLPGPETARWKAEAASVTITRDDWGIPHVNGRTDMDAVMKSSVLLRRQEPRAIANCPCALGSCLRRST